MVIEAWEAREGDVIDVKGQPAVIVRIRHGECWGRDGWGLHNLIDWESQERLPSGSWRSGGVLVRNAHQPLERIEEGK